MSHLTLRGVQQSLAARGIRMSRTDPYPDGRNRFAVWPSGAPRASAKHTDDIEHGYIIGLRMKPSNNGGSGAPACC